MRETRTHGLKAVLRKRSRRATAPEDYQCPWTISRTTASTTRSEMPGLKRGNTETVAWATPLRRAAGEAPTGWWALNLATGSVPAAPAASALKQEGFSMTSWSRRCTVIAFCAVVAWVTAPLPAAVIMYPGDLVVADAVG